MSGAAAQAESSRQTVVVLAGGLGSRVAHLTGPDRPKALLPLGGRTFIDVKLDELRVAGATDVVMLVGHGAAELRHHVGDGRHHGLRVRWIADGPALVGTGGAVRAALDQLPDVFWLTYGDTLLDVPLRDLAARFGRGSHVDDDLGMTVLRNEDRWEVSNVDVRAGRVTAYAKGEPPGRHRYLDYGMQILRRRAFDAVSDVEAPFDLALVQRAAIEAGRAAAFEVTRRFYDVGSEAGYEATQRWLATQAAAPAAASEGWAVGDVGG